MMTITYLKTYNMHPLNAFPSLLDKTKMQELWAKNGDHNSIAAVTSGAVSLIQKSTYNLARQLSVSENALSDPLNEHRQTECIRKLRST
jgi:hypothetical protein